MAQIIVSAGVVIPNGPKFALNYALEVDAYEQIDVVIPSGASNKKVELPGGIVQFIAIISDWFGDKLTYTINTAASTAPTPPPTAPPVRMLDQAHFLAGTGAVSFFAGTAPLTALYFSNSTSAATAKDAKVQILIGCDVTPP